VQWVLVQQQTILVLLLIVLPEKVYPIAITPDTFNFQLKDPMQMLELL
jgi:hypothetical protein